MGRKCVIENCCETDEMFKFRTLHRVPKSEVMRRLWVEAVGKNLSGIFYVCCRHFEPTDYASTCLKKTAVPSKHLKLSSKRPIKETSMFDGYEYQEESDKG
jgi:hypothetical protein